MAPLDAGVDRHHCQHADGAGVIRRRHIRKRSSYLLDTVIVLVGLFCLLNFLRIVLTLHLRVPLDLNDDATQGRNDGELVGLLKKRYYAALQFYSLKLKDFSLARRVREPHRHAPSGAR
jgi:hypothetical protein